MENKIEELKEKHDNEVRQAVINLVNCEADKSDVAVLVEEFDLKQCAICENWFAYDDLIDTEGKLNGGIGYVCEQCQEDNDIGR